MDIKWLETFLKIYDLDSFTAAAEALTMSQPGVSKQMQKLESELGTSLLRKEEGHLRLTEAGRKVYETSQTIVEQWQSLNKTLRLQAGQLAGKLHIGSSTIPSKHLLPNYLSHFHSLYPNVELEVTVNDSGVTLENLRHNHLDVGLVGKQPSTPDLLSFEIANDHLVVIGHKQRLEKRSWKDGPFILRESTSGTAAATNMALSELGMDKTKMNCIAQTNDSDLIITMVVADLGFAIISDLEWSNLEKTTPIHVFHTFAAERPFYVVVHKDHIKDPLPKAFIELCSHS